MSAGMTMMHRATVMRDAHAGTVDAYNNAAAPSWLLHLDQQACYYYEPRVGQTGEQRGQENALLYAHAALVPLGTDIAEGDQVTAITDRRGGAVTDRAMRVIRVMRRRSLLLLALEVVA